MKRKALPWFAASIASAIVVMLLPRAPYPVEANTTIARGSGPGAEGAVLAPASRPAVLWPAPTSAEIVRLFDGGATAWELAERFGMTPGEVTRAVMGERRRGGRR